MRFAGTGHVCRGDRWKRVSNKAKTETHRQTTPVAGERSEDNFSSHARLSSAPACLHQASLS